MRVFVVVFALVLIGCSASEEQLQRTSVEPGFTPRLHDPNTNRCENCDRVFFDYDSAQLRPDALPALKHQAEWLKRHLAERIIIEGHADERGTREYNLALGARRAAAVRVHLIAIGVPASQIADIISYGKERPAVLGSNEEAWRENRRAVSVVQ
jgi:peptidoglycan-associated lipoprotein